jgi:AcrR family transcriptional regulator
MKARAARPYRRQSLPERRADRRGRLVAAALDLFGRRGYAATSIEALCAAAAVSTRNFYEEFPSRDLLLVAAHDHVNAHVLHGVGEALGRGGAGGPRRRALVAVRAFVRGMTRDPRWTRIAYREVVGVSPAVEKGRRDWMRRWARLIESEAESWSRQGLVPQRSFSLTAIGLVGAINELVADWSSRDDPPALARVIEEIVRLCVSGLTAA